MNQIIISLNSGISIEFPNLLECRRSLANFLSPAIRVSGFRCNNESDFQELQNYIEKLSSIVLTIPKEG